jgi:lactam utilization protein B
VTASGKKLPLVAETYCIHSDTPGSVDILMYIHKRLRKEEILLQ